MTLRACVILALILVGLQALVLFAMGRPPICTCGSVKLWVGKVLSPENSQQLTDWYTPSHVIHGIILYALVRVAAPQRSIQTRFVLAVAIESVWEMLENTPFVINRYRQIALDQGYFGDSVLNSVTDTLAAIFGFLLARFLPVWASIGVIIGMELFVGFMIHDNLTLNIIQLLTGAGIISCWQISR